ncbi:UTP-glucose-1-phosphate uridylyltransferase [Fonticula alba]|uniref:UTP--glucose-1-phosphate uridylyltransferase n=1 Tax=Fonticula alba TaxID=691883 RepID=A0A058ZH69_FONAL|nr:UTP-glucose-1-phosphate uridylyltransferase [Fonticula alba]KCV73311.1 UTP-glucose-1-phosphate uridylyltransferase [Fonticula alba]|eukprot:XP_009493012.1 UTP-glucose-1-phosphate uridylyltransferase [Fonticula alba]
MIRNASLVKFESQVYSAMTEAMRRELEVLIATAPESKRLAFAQEMEGFTELFTRYHSERASGKGAINWMEIHTPRPNQILQYDVLAQPTDNIDAARAMLNKLVVLKLNGGLGTTMGCVGPKSAIEVRSQMTFLDLTVRQIEFLNQTYGCDVPLILMNSFNTTDDTAKIIQKYKSHDVRILTFNQSRYPRFNHESNAPCPNSFDSDKRMWFPPGHGDLYDSFARSGLLQEMLDQGRELMFVSNVDNLGATVDLAILQHILQSASEFVMEVTDKTRADVKGGTLVDHHGCLRLLELAQVPPQHVDEFKSISKFRSFNTNNLWMRLDAVYRVVAERTLELELIVNPKTIPETGEKVVQLETAAGAAIRFFKNGIGLSVPRSRFLPVKGTGDLLLVQSNLYSLSHGAMVLNKNRAVSTLPLIKLGSEFGRVSDYLSRFAQIPDILELDHLTVTGDVNFGSGVTLRGTVIIVATHGQRIDIPNGSILENKIVTGHLRILDH